MDACNSTFRSLAGLCCAAALSYVEKRCCRRPHDDSLITGGHPQHQAPSSKDTNMDASSEAVQSLGRQYGIQGRPINASCAATSTDVAHR